MAAAAAGVEAQLRDAKAAKAMASLQIDDVSGPHSPRALVLLLARSLLTVAACAGAQEEIMETHAPTPRPHQAPLVRPPR